MEYGEIAGVDKQVSRLVMGVDNQTQCEETESLFDDYFKLGGNCFDTAFIYGKGLSEKLVGTWIQNRGLREQVVILDKGAHTPDCDPEVLSEQLLISLDRLQTEYVDIYMLHRDNLEIPVDEFLDVLNQHKNAGRIHAYGVSNWYIPRVQQFNLCAEQTGCAPIAAVSNNFSLAVMAEPAWDGCLRATESISRAWLGKTQMPLMAWSSQARGFFVRARRDSLQDALLVRCWYTESNFRRLERAKELARKMSVEPVNIALAYVLCQPFPTFALVGPRSVAETHSCMRALDIHLSAEQVRWLNLEQ